MRAIEEHLHRGFAAVVDCILTGFDLLALALQSARLRHNKNTNKQRPPLHSVVAVVVVVLLGV